MLSAALLCLATAVYFEARGEPTVGQVAVAAVVMNRVEARRFPNDVCSVVKQGPLYRSGAARSPQMPVLVLLRRQERQDARQGSQASRHTDRGTCTVTDDNGPNRGFDFLSRGLCATKLGSNEAPRRPDKQACVLPMVSAEKQKRLKDTQIERGTHERRRCLTCLEIRVVEKGMFICPECKDSGIFQGLGG
jgi:hypothetical protein